MPLLRTLEVRSLENPQVSISQAMDLLGGPPTYSGRRVTEEVAMKAVAVLACVRVLAETVAHLPLNLHRRLKPRGKELAREHRLFRLLHDQPNPEMSSFTFRETMMVNLLLFANAYAEIQRNGKREIVAVWPLLSDRTRLVNKGAKRLYYETRDDEGRERELDPASVFHLATLSLDGMNGWFCVRLFREAIGVMLAMEEFGARWFGQGGHAGGLLRHPAQMSEEGHKRLRDSWERLQSGVANAHKVAILEEGIDYKAIAVPPEESQFLESQQFGVTQAARAFRIPPHMIGDLTRATFSNIEQQSLSFYQETMLPWFKRWEQEITRQLITPEEQVDLFAEFNADGILRGDIVSRYDAYSKGRQVGLLSTNEAREKENMDPIDGGDDYLRPLNLVPVDDDPPPEPAPEPPARSVEPAVEKRANSGAMRRRLTLAFQPLMKDTVSRLLRIEARDVAKAAERFLDRGQVREFVEWLGEYYFERHPKVIVSRVEGAFRSFAESIAAAAAEEIAGDPVEAERIDEFVSTYATAYAARHAAQSRAQATRRAEDPPAGKTAAEAVRETTEDWQSDRPQRVAEDESHRLGSATARMVFAALGVMALRWRTAGSETCPLCQQMSGKRVAIDRPFVAQGEALNPAGPTAPLVPTTDIRHPPLHDGCVCSLEPDLG